MGGLWQTHSRTIDPDRFRAPDQFLSEPPGYPYADLQRWARREHPHLLDAFTEDGAFGCHVSVAEPWSLVSRDRLDSVCEVGFLERALVGLDRMRVLDIGAGYGRFAHRLTTAYPETFVYCTDAHARSIECCERYLAHRRVTRAMVLERERLGCIEEPIGLAVNIHCFSECSHGQVCWWIDLISISVPYLFIVPHESEFRTWVDGQGAVGESYLPYLRACGWRVTAEWYGPECWPRGYYLFERQK